MIENDDYFGLIESLKKFSAFDLATFSKQLLNQSNKRHFKILAAKLMAKHAAFPAALKILMTERAELETLLVLGQCGNAEFSEALLVRYSNTGNLVMFLVVAYVLFDHLRADVIVENSSMANMDKACLPIYCQLLRNKLK